MAYELIYFNNMSEEQWKYYYDIVHNKSYSSLESLKEKFKTIFNLSYFSRIFFITKDKTLIGCFTFTIGSSTRPDNATLATHDIVISDNALNIFLIDTLAKAMDEYKKKLIFMIHRNPFKELFLEHNIRVLRKVYSQILYFNNKTVLQLKEIYASYEFRNKFHIKFFNTLPDELIGLYCEGFTNIVRNIPGRSEEEGKYTFTPWECRYSETESAKNGWKNIYAMAFKGNQLEGIASLTYGKTTGGVFHFITGILESSRNMGLSKYIKAAIYLQLLKEYPDARNVRTDVYDNNPLILKINEGLGFKIDREQYEFEVSIPDLQRIIRELQAVPAN